MAVEPATGDQENSDTKTATPPPPTANDGAGSNGPPTDRPDIDRCEIILLTVVFILWMLLMVHFIAVLWPPATEKNAADKTLPPKWEDVQFLWFYVFWVTREVRLILLVLSVGSLGSFIHVATSFSDFAGNNSLRARWLPWYMLRPFVGAALALMFYFGVRGGLMTSSASATDDVNVFGTCAIAALAGMFSKQATDKLREIFMTLFKTDQDRERKDKLDGQGLQITSFEPAQLQAGKATSLTILGSNFDSKAYVMFGAEKLTPAAGATATQIKVDIPAEKLVAGEVQVTVVNPADKGGSSSPVSIKVVA